MGHTARLTQLDDGRMVDEHGVILDLRQREGTFVYVPGRPKWHEGWFMAIQDAFVALAKDKAVRGRPRAVLDYMMGKLNWENYVAVSQAEIAQEIDIHRSHVSAAVKLLVERGILQEGPKLGRSHSYRLNSAYGWKGKIKDLEERRRNEIREGFSQVFPSQQIGLDGQLHPHQNPS